MTLELPDGRRIAGTSLRRSEGGATIETFFGPLHMDRQHLRARRAKEAEAERPPEKRRTTTSAWVRIDSDITGSRVKSYLEYLDAFIPYLLRTYGLDPGKVRQEAPFDIHIYRSREAYKRVQRLRAPGIATKGSDFAEGVVGFYRPEERCIYMWDDDPLGRSPSPRTALHETTHLINHYMARQERMRLPVWFEEGTATYFEMYVPARSEPSGNTARLISVAGEVRAGRPMGNRALRAMAYAAFHGREYAWSCALIQFLRTSHGGKPWHAAVGYLHRAARAGAGRKRETNGFAQTLGWKDDAALDGDWYRDLAATKLAPGSRDLGASAGDLAGLAALRQPTRAQAILFARLGRAFAGTSMAGAAVAYLEAALRGGIDDADLRLLLAQALAERVKATSDEPWPEAALDHLRAAVRLAPLDATCRAQFGQQLLLRATTATEAGEALGALGLALLLVRPQDDEEWIAQSTLVAAVRMRPDATARQTLAWLEAGAPSTRDALRQAWIYFLQEEEEWDDLVVTLEERAKAGSASFEHREMLAGLYFAGNRQSEAAVLYKTLLKERPAVLRLWPPLIRALVQDGRLAEARAAKVEALAALEHAGRPSSHVRRSIERIRIR